MIKNRIFKLVTFLVVNFFVFSCMGSFNLTNTTYDWNKTVGNKYANEFVFFGLVIIPVYGLTLILDALFINSVEFWSNKNPMESMEKLKQENREEYVTRRKSVIEKLLEE